jgi:predicted SAM-dependent methyltransferase
MFALKMKREQPGIIHKVIKRVRIKFDQLYPEYLGNKFQCPVCETNLAYFLPLPAFYLKELYDNQAIHSLFSAETLSLDTYLCPACQCSDRDRLYALYSQKTLANQETQKLRLIEFAPALPLRQFLKRLPHIEYRSADLFMPEADDCVDITDMKIYADESFDIFICSHVLEHVEDDRRAMRELYRILRHGGWGIAMVPISLALEENYENSAAQSEAERWKHFGQNDHVRMYSKAGFINNLNDAGFEVEQFGVEQFGRETLLRHGIHPRSTLYIARKK